MYFGVGTNLCALDKDGQTAWTTSVSGKITTTPLVTADGIVYVGTSANAIEVVGSDGARIESLAIEIGPIRSPVLAAEGIVYVAAGSRFIAFANRNLPAAGNWSMHRGDAKHSGSLFVLPDKLQAPSIKSSVPEDRGVKIQWASVPGASGYEVWRGTNAIADVAVPIVENLSGRTDYVDRSAPVGITNHYWVRATAAGGRSDFSDPVAGLSRAIQPGDMIWELNLDEGIASNPVVFPDGSIWISGGTYALGATHGKLYSIRTNGTLASSVATDLPLSYLFGVDRETVAGVRGYAPTAADDLFQILPRPRRVYVQGRLSGLPAVRADGSIYLPLFKSLAALNFRELADGYPGFLWNVPAPDPNISQPAIGADGSGYFGAGTNVFAVNRDGLIRWVVAASKWVNSNAVLDGSGNVYLRSRDNASGPFVSLLSLAADGSPRWEFVGFNEQLGPPVTGSDGGIYFGSDKRFYALNEDGSMRWSVEHPPSPSQYNTHSYGSPALAADGTVYFASNTNLFAFGSDGSTRWVFSRSPGFVTAPVLSADGTIYIGGGSTQTGARLYAIHGAAGPDSDAWPMFAQNAQFTSRLPQRFLSTPRIDDNQTLSLEASVEVGRTYRIQSSPNLIDWSERDSVLATNTVILWDNLYLDGRRLPSEFFRLTSP